MVEKFEFMSREWIAMARDKITRALAGRNLGTKPFTLCEEFTDPPHHLRSPGSQTVGFCVRVRDGQVAVADRPMEGADCTIVSDYADALAVARDPDAPADDPAVMQQRIAAGRLKVIGDPSGAPPGLAEVNIHKLLAPHTA